MALFTWDQIANLDAAINFTTAKKTVAANFEAIGTARLANQTPNISGVTAADAKKVRNFFRDLNRIRLAVYGAEYVLQRLNDDTGKSAVDAVPDGNL